jgi:hypothetical protein
MSSAVWRPVVAIGGSGLALGLAPNGLWVVGDGSSVSRITDRLMALLPLLEQPYRKVDQTVAAQV